MEWIEIDYSGLEVEVIDFLDGVLVRDPQRFGLAFVPGYYVQMQSGDRDVPRLARRTKKSPTFSLQWVQDE